jgi:hypothetical protein
MSNDQVDFGYGPGVKRMYVNLKMMPARCLREWPQESFGRISKFFLVQLNYITRVKEWWWWW